MIFRPQYILGKFGKVGWSHPKQAPKSWSWKMLAAAIRDWNYHWIMSSPEKVLLPNETWSETRFWELFPTRHFHLRCWLYFKSSLDIEHEFAQMCKILQMFFFLLKTVLWMFVHFVSPLTDSNSIFWQLWAILILTFRHIYLPLFWYFHLPSK